jgi:cytochrome oxidase Cu insertion factor (SCO1/SenC/PrrC family)
VKRDPVVIIVVAMVVSLMLVFGFNMARKTKDKSVPGPQTKGDTAPDFTLPSLDGKNTRLSDFRGQAVVLTLQNRNALVRRTAKTVRAPRLSDCRCRHG